MSDWRQSKPACFLMERFGGETPEQAMRLAVTKLMAKDPHESLPIYPSRYAKRCRANPKPIFIRMSLDGALKLDANQFQILIRDATLNLELPLLDNLEAARTRNTGSPACQLVFDYEQVSQAFQQHYIPASPKQYKVETVFECQYDAYLPQHTLRRQRFTYAHELCHTLFYDLKADLPYRPYAYDRRESDLTEESLCNLGAGCLLMPDHLIKKYVSQNPVKPGFLLQFCSEFHVSLEAAAVQIARSGINTPDDAILIVSKHSVNRYTGRDQKLRIRACIVPQRLRSTLFIPENIGTERLGLASLNTVTSYRFNDDHFPLSGKEVLSYKNFNHKVEYVHTRIPGNHTVVISHLRLID